MPQASGGAMVHQTLLQGGVGPGHSALHGRQPQGRRARPVHVIGTSV